MGVTIVPQGVVYILDGHNPLFMLIGLVAVVGGALLLIGYLTPFAGVMAALSGISRALAWSSMLAGNLFDTRLTVAFEVAIAIALVFLGPGAFSVDARIFGRREIVIPRSPLPPN